MDGHLFSPRKDNQEGHCTLANMFASGMKDTCPIDGTEIGMLYQRVEKLLFW
jgi:hypothetical protein